MAQCPCKITSNTIFSAAIMLVLNDSSSEDEIILISDADLYRVADSIVVKGASSYKEDKKSEIVTVSLKLEKPSCD